MHYSQIVLKSFRQHFWVRAVSAAERQRTHMGRVSFLLLQFRKLKCHPGCFMLYNTGKEAVTSTHGLLTTVAYQVLDNTMC